LIDIENKVQDEIFNALTTAFPGIAVYGEAVEKSATFPAATVWETDNRPYRQSETEQSTENNAVVTYEINAYSDLQSGAKLQAKAIIAEADRVMQSLGFRRLLRRRVANLDRTIYRMYARYEAVVSQPYVDGDNTVYKINRR
jgi:hypothetical protein